MKTLLKIAIAVVLLLNVMVLFSQEKDYQYVTATMDFNKLTGLVDNPRTKVDVLGVDFHLEAGVRHKQNGIYIYYGAFQERDYQTFGGGYDRYVNWLGDKIDLSIGADLSVVMRKDGNGNWGGYNPHIGLRAQTILWFGDVGIILISKGQPRPDIGKFIYEGDFGVTVRF